MFTHEVNDLSILAVLAKYDTKLTTNELFDFVAGKVVSDEDPVNFLKIMNNLRDLKLAETSYNRNSLVYWHITDIGRERLFRAQ
ncbi:MAG: hypothetical protein ABIN89_02120 [Chitinophagaceae bacterium]